LQGHGLVIEADDFAGALVLVPVHKAHHIAQGDKILAAHLQHMTAFEVATEATL
jgi:hypothetical protein